MRNMDQNHPAEEGRTPGESLPGGLPKFKLQEDEARGVSLLAQVTTLAWNLVIPIVGGALLGSYLDNRGTGGTSWTLSLLVLGVIVAFSNLYNLYIEHGKSQEKSEEKEAVREDTHEEEK